MVFVPQLRDAQDALLKMASLTAPDRSTNVPGHPIDSRFRLPKGTYIFPCIMRAFTWNIL